MGSDETMRLIRDPDEPGSVLVQINPPQAPPNHPTLAPAEDSEASLPPPRSRVSRALLSILPCLSLKQALEALEKRVYSRPSIP